MFRSIVDTERYVKEEYFTRTTPSPSCIVLCEIIITFENKVNLPKPFNQDLVFRFSKVIIFAEA